MELAFLTCLAATFLVKTIRSSNKNRYVWLFAFVALLITPSLLKHKKWASEIDEPISVGIIQANLSMRISGMNLFFGNY